MRRLLYLGVLMAALAASACGESKPSTGGNNKKIDDPDASPVPKAGGSGGGVKPG